MTIIPFPTPDADRPGRYNPYRLQDPTAAAAFRELNEAIDEAGSPACEQDPEMWWTMDRTEQVYVKKLCYDCAVIQNCLKYALIAQEPDGIWGGTDPAERASIMRRADGRKRGRFGREIAEAA